jgi:putative membrane protein
MNLIKKLFSENEFRWTLLRFYIVGFLLYIIPFTRAIFIYLIPWILLANVAIMLVFHKDRNLKSLSVFVVVILAAFLLEMKGVHDDRLFGSYRYLDALGPQIRDTPLIIGINWLMLVYGAHSLISEKFRKRLPRLLLASILMVVYDIIIEVAAPDLKMWIFDKSYPPLRNFFMWFAAALFFQLLFEIAGIRTANRHARELFLAQMLFFAVLVIYLTLGPL